MAIPTFMYLVSASQALPIAAVAAVRGQPLPVPYRRLALFCCLLIAFDVIDLLVSARTGDNQWTAYYTGPIEVGMTLWILSAWQPDDQRRRRYLLAIPGVGAAVAITLLLIDPSRDYDVWVAPFLALLALVAALHTLVTRTLHSREALGNLDWFWISLGLAIFWVVQISAPVFMSAFLATRPDWVMSVLLVRAGLMMCGFVLIAWGVVCPRTRSV